MKNSNGDSLAVVICDLRMIWHRGQEVQLQEGVKLSGSSNARDRGLLTREGSFPGKQRSVSALFCSHSGTEASGLSSGTPSGSRDGLVEAHANTLGIGAGARVYKDFACGASSKTPCGTRYCSRTLHLYLNTNVCLICLNGYHKIFLLIFCTVLKWKKICTNP